MRLFRSIALCLVATAVALAKQDAPRATPDNAEAFLVDDINPEELQRGSFGTVSGGVFLVPEDIKRQVLPPTWATGWDEFEFFTPSTLPKLLVLDKISDIVERAMALTYLVNEGELWQYDGKDVGKESLPWDKVEKVWLMGSTEYQTECGPDSPNPTDCWKNRRQQDEL